MDSGTSTTNFTWEKQRRYAPIRSSITREDQDQFAVLSYRRALEAQQRGEFRREIVSVPVSQRDGADQLVEEDEEPKRVSLERLPTLKPAFRKDGRVTAGNASSISDGAAALVVMLEEKAKALRLNPLARIVGYGSFATDPAWFTTAPVHAISTLLKKTGRKITDVDLFEINEAFAVCSIAVNRELGLNPDRVNVRGGAVASGSSYRRQWRENSHHPDSCVGRYESYHRSR